MKFFWQDDVWKTDLASGKLYICQFPVAGRSVSVLDSISNLGNYYYFIKINVNDFSFEAAFSIGDVFQMGFGQNA